MESLILALDSVSNGWHLKMIVSVDLLTTPRPHGIVFSYNGHAAISVVFSDPELVGKFHTLGAAEFLEWFNGRSYKNAAERFNMLAARIGESDNTSVTQVLRGELENLSSDINLITQWFFGKGVIPPTVELRSVPPPQIEPEPEDSSNIRVSRPLRLSPNETEALNDKIVEQVQEYKELGRGSLTTIFQMLSKESLELFGHKLSPKSIEGRYSREK